MCCGGESAAGFLGVEVESITEGEEAGSAATPVGGLLAAAGSVVVVVEANRMVCLSASCTRVRVKLVSEM